MVDLGLVHDGCHYNNGICDRFCMLFTHDDSSEKQRKTCTICGHLKQFHEVSYIFLSSIES